MAVEVDTVVIGAGVAGLACAAELARCGREVLVLERHDGPGRETSSRNSGVIHAGFYYETGSLKARTCVEGRRLLYQRCARDGVPHRRTGKLVVATDDAEAEALAALLERGEANGVEGLSLVDDAEVRRLEPRLRARAALRSSESGVVDVHGLLDSYAAEATSRGAQIAYRVALRGAERAAGGWRLSTLDADGAPFEVTCAQVVNAAGLRADRVAERFGVDVDARGWRLRWCKGDYFKLASRLRGAVERLVYPMPTHAGLGVHLTVDLGGELRAGPDATYVDDLDYDVAPDKAEAFAAAVARYLPGVGATDLSPDYAGVRPKLYGAGEPARDFVLERVDDVVHLVGIESPGITSSESLARLVASRLARG
jgi:L-2-hydroxyglutarate oxidase LhgO